MSGKRTLLVIGGGIAGLTATVEAAEIGYSVDLIEQEPSLGGRVLQSYRYFPKFCPPACGMEINLKRLKTNGLIQVFTMARVMEITGDPGAFEVTLDLSPRYVNERCTACGKCAEVCQTEIPNFFNYGLDRMKAAYLPHDFAFPMRYVLSPETIETEDSRRCQEACGYGAIDVSMQHQTVTREVSAIIVATGWKPYDASKIHALGFGKFPDVISNVMMERLASSDGPTRGQIVRRSDGKDAKRVAFCQCAGQRDRNHLSFCSRVCCLASLKQARYVLERFPDAEIYIFYIDLRTMGLHEQLLSNIRSDKRIHLIRGKVARISEQPDTRSLVVEAEATEEGRIVRIEVDLCCTCDGDGPHGCAGQDPRSWPCVRRDGFFRDLPGILPPVRKRPMDVAESVQDATSTVLKAIGQRKQMGK
jgi:quinone-modifying oxidoreductase subunit QmoA